MKELNIDKLLDKLHENVVLIKELTSAIFESRKNDDEFIRDQIDDFLILLNELIKEVKNG